MSQLRGSINEYSAFISESMRSKGFKVEWDNMLAPLMLVVTEVAEAAEAWRKDDRANFEEEIADTVIRLMDLAGALGIDLEDAIVSKMEKNLKRPYMHGKRA